MTRLALIVYLNREMKAKRSAIRFIPDPITNGIRVKQNVDPFIDTGYSPRTNEEFASYMQKFVMDLTGGEIQWNNDGSQFSVWKDKNTLSYLV